MHRHPKADIAVLVLKSAGVFDPFVSADYTPEWGEEVSAFGYPEDTSDKGIRPTPRFFRGNIQRVLQHQGLDDTTYLAAELSFPAPAGCSGGPVAPRNRPGCAIGVVAENKLTSTYLHTINEHRDETGSFSEKVHSTTEYGLAVLLQPLLPWLTKLARDTALG